MTPSPNERDRVYFFAQDERFVPLYDLIEDVLNPYLQATHDLMVELVVNSIGRERTDSANRTVLVVGSGTGGEVLRLAKALPSAKIVAVDFSPLMNAQLKAKYAAHFPELGFDSNVHLL